MVQVDAILQVIKSTFEISTKLIIMANILQEMEWK